MIAGYMVAAQRQIHWGVFLAVLVGTALVIASGCVLNNYIDRGIDVKMARTKQRALASGRIPPGHALVFAAVLSLVGFGLLARYTNLLTVYVGMFGLYVYVIAYGLAKRRTPLGTIIGSFSGSTPILAGYTAASGRLDATAGLLFAALLFWQMPHFYAIAMYRLDDYRSAGLPVLPAAAGAHRTKLHSMVYIVLFAITAVLMAIIGPAGLVYLGIMLILSAAWLWKGFIGFKSNNDTVWARRMFRFSLLVLLVFSVLLAISPYTP